MNRLQDRQLEFKIAPEDSLSLIGSNSIFTSGSSHLRKMHAISQPSNRRAKRAFDFFTALAMLFLLPLDIWFVHDKGGFVRNIFAVLAGRKSWVGCSLPSNAEVAGLKPGVLSPVDAFPNNTFSSEMIATADQLYTQDYSVRQDVRTVARGFGRLGLRRET